MGSRTPGRAAKPSPLYEKVKRHVLEQMSRGQLPQGARLPSEHALMAHLGVSRMTVHRALRELSAGGHIFRVQGLGSFVAVPPARTDLMAIRDIADEIALRGHRHASSIVALGRCAAGRDQAARLEILVGAELLHSLVLHREDDVPVQLEERFVLPSFAPGYLGVDFETTTASRYLQDVAPADEVEHLVAAVRPSTAVCDLLEIGSDEPCLSVMRRTWVDGVPVTDSLFTYPGTRYGIGARHRLDPRTRG